MFHIHEAVLAAQLGASPHKPSQPTSPHFPRSPSLPNMPINIVANWLRIALLVLSFLSFLPQLRHTIAKRSSTGISLCYLLFNLFSVTEQFSLAFFFVVDHVGNPTVFCHDPVTVGDWLNLVQTGVVGGVWLGLYVKCLVLLSSSHGGIVNRTCSGASSASSSPQTTTTSPNSSSSHSTSPFCTSGSLTSCTTTCIRPAKPAK